VLCDVPEVDSWLTQAISEFLRSAAGAQLLHRRYEVDAPWLGDGKRQRLQARYLLERRGNEIAVSAFVADAEPGGIDTGTVATVSAPATGLQELEAIARRHDAAVIDFGAPLSLSPVAIPKPWGQELWYTGVERRGLSDVVGSTGRTPLPWVLSLAPGHLTNGNHPTLLKILDPWPDPLYGDLYLEMHDVKQEVYIVTHVDPRAWPDGAGAIRYGLDPALRRRYAHDNDLRGDFLAAVRAYEQVRRHIDEIFETNRQRSGIAAGKPVPPSVLRQWHTELPADLQADEAKLRRVMESFTAVHPLRAGDVVAVPLGAPHSLQHGVRVVEFQTPVYERQIIAFAQKVLTQDHWDSATAIERMSLECPSAPEPERVVDDGDCTAERIVAFSDFAVWRVRLSPGAGLSLPDGLPYALLMTVQGQVSVAGLQRNAEQACLIPRQAIAHAITNPGTGTSLCLVAAPSL
jgi:hypothetical protein